MNPVSKSQSYDEHLLLFQNLKEQLLAAHKKKIIIAGNFDIAKPFDWSHYNFNIHEELMALLDVFGEFTVGHRSYLLINLHMPFQGQNNWTGDFAKDWGSHFEFGELCGCWDPRHPYSDDEITDHIWFASDVDATSYGMLPGRKEVFNLWGEVVGNNLYEWLLEFLQYHDVGFQWIKRKNEGKD